MATKVGILPKTMPSPETGETLTLGVRPFKVTYKGRSITVDLPGENGGRHLFEADPAYQFVKPFQFARPSAFLLGSDRAAPARCRRWFRIRSPPPSDISVSACATLSVPGQGNR